MKMKKQLLFLLLVAIMGLMMLSTKNYAGEATGMFQSASEICTVTEGCTLEAGHKGACVSTGKKQVGVTSFVSIILLPPKPQEKDLKSGKFTEENGVICYYQDVKDSLSNARSGNAYEFKYELDEKAHTAALVEVKGVDSHFKDANLEVLETIRYQNVDYTVIAIGEKVFEKKCPKTIKLPDTITIIGDDAFKDCKGVSINIS